MRYFFVMNLLAGLLSSCAYLSNEPMAQKESAPTPPTEASSYRLIEQGEFQKSLDAIDRDLLKNPIGPKTVTHQYAAGLALMGLARFDEAIDRFQIVLRQTEKSDNELFTQALYQRGKAFEAIGDDAKSLAAYFDVQKRKVYLEPEVADVEVPVRIAGVYMRQGQPQQADEYYKAADRGLEKLRRREDSAVWMPKALFNMGKSSPREVSRADFAGGLVAFKRSQGYLIRSMEFNRSPWSGRAAQELRWLLESAWRTVQAVDVDSSGDTLADLRSQQEARIEMALALDGSVTLIRKEFLPGLSEKSPYVVDFQSFLDQYERKLDSLISARPVQEGLTDEAQKRQGVLREGKVIDPQGTLEKKARVKGNK